MIELKNIEKTYRRGVENVRALRGVNLTIESGELMAIVGPSGAGKTTLLHILGCLDQPTNGDVIFDGVNTASMPESQLVKIRREKIGFVFQQFYLIPGLSVFDNIALPLLFSKKPGRTMIEAMFQTNHFCQLFNLFALCRFFTEEQRQGDIVKNT